MAFEIESKHKIVLTLVVGLPEFASRPTSGKRRRIFNDNDIELITITCDEMKHVVGVENTLQFERFRKTVCKPKVHRSWNFPQNDYKFSFKSSIAHLICKVKIKNGKFSNQLTQIKLETNNGRKHRAPVVSQTTYVVNLSQDLSKSKKKRIPKSILFLIRSSLSQFLFFFCRYFPSLRRCHQSERIWLLRASIDYT